MDYEPTFFDTNIGFYGRTKPRWHDYYFLNFINNSVKKSSVLDVGGGAGVFSSLVKNNHPYLDVTIVDPSQVLLEEISDTRINKTNGMLPNDLGLDVNSTFGYIHLSEVFHHLVGSTIYESKDLTKESLLVLREYLDDDGFLMIHEIFFEGYLFPTLPRSFIFYLLKAQNNLKIRIPIKDFLLGLQVCFYTRDEFSTLLKLCGFRINNFSVNCRSSSWMKTMGFIKEWGSMVFIAQKSH